MRKQYEFDYCLFYDNSPKGLKAAYLKTEETLTVLPVLIYNI